MKYIGNELELFAKAINWKEYWSSKVVPYIKGDVMEVGAGIGGTTNVLVRKSNYKSWLCLEPDQTLASQISDTLDNHTSEIRIVCGFVQDLDPDKKFDTILYIDVIEHIENDDSELKKAYERLNPGGALIILVPAFNWLFSPFDEAVGHFRRYTKTMLKAVVPKELRKEKLNYLDFGGFLASVVNKLLLQQSIPTLKQISFWDRVIVPCSKIVDPLIGYSAGKTLVGIWIKHPNDSDA